MGIIMEQLLLTLLENSDKISAAVGIIIVMLILVRFMEQISKRAEDASQREDKFQDKLLDLHTKTVSNNDKIVGLLQVHEDSAKDRATAQENRDNERLELSRQQTEAMSKIINYLDVVGDTKNTVDNIETTS